MPSLGSVSNLWLWCALAAGSADQLLLPTLGGTSEPLTPLCPSIWEHSWFGSPSLQGPVEPLPQLCFRVRKHRFFWDSSLQDTEKPLTPAEPQRLLLPDQRHSRVKDSNAPPGLKAVADQGSKPWRHIGALDFNKPIRLEASQPGHKFNLRCYVNQPQSCSINFV